MSAELKRLKETLGEFCYNEKIKDYEEFILEAFAPILHPIQGVEKIKRITELKMKVLLREQPTLWGFDEVFEIFEPYLSTQFQQEVKPSEGVIQKLGNEYAQLWHLVSDNRGWFEQKKQDYIEGLRKGLSLSTPSKEPSISDEITVEFEIDFKFFTGPYTIMELLDIDKHMIIENMEECDCHLTESSGICEGDCIKFEGSEITGFRLSPSSEVEKLKQEIEGLEERNTDLHLSKVELIKSNAKLSQELSFKEKELIELHSVNSKNFNAAKELESSPKEDKKELSEITDEDAIGLAKIIDKDAKEIYLSDGIVHWEYDFLDMPFETSIDLNNKDVCVPLRAFQYLQSKNYEL